MAGADDAPAIKLYNNKKEQEMYENFAGEPHPFPCPFLCCFGGVFKYCEELALGRGGY